MLKLDMIRRRGEVIFSDGTRESGDFFVSPSSASHTGRESIAELLNGERSYIPLESRAGEVVLLQKRSIVMVLLEADEMRKDLAYQRRITAQVRFLSGESMEGTVYLDLPKSHSRLSDFLNYSKAFFYLEVGDKDYLVNSQFVKMVCPSPPD
ncbi:MAG: hypothetical protein PVG85_03890 [Deltaproteobacteria bacterium]